METAYLKTFVEVVRCGGYSKAAKTLCVTQSAVSRRIQFMEAQFMTRYEGKVDIRLSFETPAAALEGVRKNRHDVIVIEHWDELDFSPHCAATLGEDEMIFISSPRLGLPSPVVGVDELIRQRLYRRGDDCCSGTLLAFNMAAIGRNPKEFDKVLHYDDLNVIIESVCAGEGIALVSRSLVERRIEEGTLRGHRVEGFRHSRKRTLVYRDKILRDQPTRYFIDCIGNAFGLGPERQPPPP